VLWDGDFREKYRRTFSPIRGVDFKPAETLLVRYAEELPRHLDISTFPVESLFDVFQRHVVRRDKYKLKNDISSTETADVQSVNARQNNRGTFFRYCANEETSAFVSRKPDTIKETIVQVRKSRHARILLHEIVNWQNIASLKTPQ
jgi:hypothetical protein